MRRCHRERVGSAKTHDRGHAQANRRTATRRGGERERERERETEAEAEERESARKRADTRTRSRARSARPLRTHASALEAKELGGLGGL